MTNPQAHIQQVIDDLVASDREAGLQVAAYHRGRLVVDAWSGGAEGATGRKVDGDTLFVVFSVTKGITAIAFHILADRGVLDYDAPVARYWPEFAQNGKGAITLRQVLSHTAGLPHLPLDTTPEDLADWDKQVRWIEGAAPLWEPGTQGGYHALTYGTILGEVAQRADGRPFARIVREEICAPLGIETLFLGASEELDDQIATLDLRADPGMPAPPPESLLWQIIPAPLHPLNTMANNRAFRHAVVPAGGAVANARALARAYAALVGDGVDGVRLLSPERVRLAAEVQYDAVDVIFGTPTARALGFARGGCDGARLEVFGHGGAGGFTAQADATHDLAYALCKTRMVETLDPSTSAAVVFERELYRALGIG